MAQDEISEFDVRNPATGSVLKRVPDASPADLDAAVARARAAFPGFAALTYAERREMLDAFGDRVLAYVDELKRLLTSEQGKPYVEAEQEIMAFAFYIKGMLALDLPVDERVDMLGRVAQTHRRPLGVVGAITPWNFPVALAAFKLAPALLTGNTVVLKPSPYTPLTTLRIAELAEGVLPPGALTVITGSDRLGPWITAHPGIDKVSFTGSTETGRRVMASAANTLKRVTLELGGNDAAIVLPDVNVGEVAQRLFWSAFTNAGQLCIAVKRLYIHRDIYEPLKQALLDYAATIRVGEGAEKGTQIGPLNNKAQYDRVRELIADARDRGYAVLSGEAPADDLPGYFVPITFVDNPPEDSRIVQEEQFGPVLPLIVFDDVEDAIARANASPYGLGGSIWSADVPRATALARRLEAGTVWINESAYISPLSPFAGNKQSGLGAEGGIESLMEYTQPQTLFLPQETPSPLEAAHS
ncbi:MAG TPA: aldehyde dehydrogenase family protein [Sphingobium sp.]|uniref:aldehyde dehydrogenase family protein n=1 Tax=Sphingobium sp. TaxID=1912891 RepID=UPI002ED63622